MYCCKDTSLRFIVWPIVAVILGAHSVAVAASASITASNQQGAIVSASQGAVVTTPAPTQKPPVKQQVAVVAPKQISFSCPQPSDLVKNDASKWVSNDDRWSSYTPSSATKVITFVGAQWVGIKVGRITCLYKTDEAVAFPVALEKIRGEPTLEPRSGGWSALVGNRRFCQSASTADCVFYPQPASNRNDVYKDITYNPDKYSVTGEDGY